MTLQQEYCDSKIYPMFPRYNILKDMIKDVTHHPDYMEHRHESRYYRVSLTTIAPVAQS